MGHRFGFLFSFFIGFLSPFEFTLVGASVQVENRNVRQGNGHYISLV